MTSRSLQPATNSGLSSAVHRGPGGGDTRPRPLEKVMLSGPRTTWPQNRNPSPNSFDKLGMKMDFYPRQNCWILPLPHTPFWDCPLASPDPGRRHIYIWGCIWCWMSCIGQQQKMWTGIQMQNWSRQRPARQTWCMGAGLANNIWKKGFRIINSTYLIDTRKDCWIQLI